MVLRTSLAPPSPMRSGSSLLIQVVFPLYFNVNLIKSFLGGLPIGKLLRLLKGICVNAAPPYRQSQNGLVQSHWRVAPSMARSFLAEASLPKQFWIWAVHEATLRWTWFPASSGHSASKTYTITFKLGCIGYYRHPCVTLRVKASQALPLAALTQPKAYCFGIQFCPDSVCLLITLLIPPMLSPTHSLLSCMMVESTCTCTTILPLASASDEVYPPGTSVVFSLSAFRKNTIFARKCWEMHKPLVRGISVYILASKYLVTARTNSIFFYVCMYV